MKKLRTAVLATVYVSWIFWPWLLGIVEAVRWFLRMPLLHQWDADRVAMAFIWPVPAFAVFLFLAWAYSAALE